MDGREVQEGREAPGAHEGREVPGACEECEGPGTCEALGTREAPGTRKAPGAPGVPPDVFDRLMGMGPLRAARPLFEKWREPLLYLFFGGCTFFVNIGSYALLTRLCGLHALLANVVAWVVGVVFAYATNHTWVFRSNVQGWRGVATELCAFATGRLATLAMEEAVLWLGITLLAANDLLVKIAAQVLVIVANFLISKFVVFKKKG